MIWNYFYNVRIGSMWGQLSLDGKLKTPIKFEYININSNVVSLYGKFGIVEYDLRNKYNNHHKDPVKLIIPAEYDAIYDTLGRNHCENNYPYLTVRMYLVKTQQKKCNVDLYQSKDSSYTMIYSFQSEESEVVNFIHKIEETIDLNSKD